MTKFAALILSLKEKLARGPENPEKGLYYV
jgi:hypothetical protein